MNKKSVPFTFMETGLPVRTRAMYLLLFCVGCIWIGMGLYTAVTFMQKLQSINLFSYFGITTFLVSLLVFTQIMLGVGFIRAQKWVVSVLGIHILVTLFVLLVVLPILDLQYLIIPSLYSLLWTYIPLFFISFAWRGYLIGSANQILVNAAYFVAISCIATINTFLQVFQI